jgi:hypothetical protein
VALLLPPPPTTTPSLNARDAHKGLTTTTLIVCSKDQRGPKAGEFAAFARRHRRTFDVQSSFLNATDRRRPHSLEFYLCHWRRLSAQFNARIHSIPYS